MIVINDSNFQYYWYDLIDDLLAWKPLRVTGAYFFSIIIIIFIIIIIIIIIIVIVIVIVVVAVLHTFAAWKYRTRDKVADPENRDLMIRQRRRSWKRRWKIDFAPF